MAKLLLFLKYLDKLIKLFLIKSIKDVYYTYLTLFGPPKNKFLKNILVKKAVKVMVYKACQKVQKIPCCYIT